MVLVDDLAARTRLRWCSHRGRGRGVARGGRAPKIKYVTQADVRPPRFVVFSTGFLEAGYRRFLERKFREQFGFAGTPIEVSVKVREGRGSDKPRG